MICDGIMKKLCLILILMLFLFRVMVQDERSKKHRLNYSGKKYKENVLRLRLFITLI